MNLQERCEKMLRNKDATKIVIASMEVAYLPKEIDPLGIIRTGDGGGLADITAAIFEEGLRQGLDIILTIPNFRDLFRRQSGLPERDFNNALSEVSMHPNINLLEGGIFWHADKVYDDESYAISRVNVRRAYDFSKQLTEFGIKLNRFFPEADKIFQLNEWPTALAAPGLKFYDETGRLKVETKWHNVLTLDRPLVKLNQHGLNTQRYHRSIFYTNVFPSDDHGTDMHRRDLRVGFLETGLSASHQTTAVSTEILQEAIDGTLEKLVGGDNVKRICNILRDKFRRGEAGAVPNEPTRLSNPETNPWLNHRYGTKDIMDGAGINTCQFRKEMGLADDMYAPIIYWPHRLCDPQKGAKAFLNSVEDLLYVFRDQRLQFAFVANGDRELVNWTEHLQRKYPGRVAKRQFNRALSELGKAGSHFYMMPSLWEPSGMPQLEAPNYGRRTLARETGRLKSLRHGWTFRDLDIPGFRYVVGEALKFHRLPYEQKEGILQEAREDNLKEHNPKVMIKNQIDVWNYMLRDTGRKIILREISPPPQ